MGRPKIWGKEEILAELRKLAQDGKVIYRNQSGGLRAAVEREFGTWRNACKEAGIEANPKGRPKKNG